MPEVGDIFEIDLKQMFWDGFDEGLRGTPEFGEVPFEYGTVSWVGDGDVPGTGEYDAYDWKVAPFERIALESWWLELRVVEVDDEEGWVDSELVGWYGMPHVKLSFDEFDEYAQFE